MSVRAGGNRGGFAKALLWLIAAGGLGLGVTVFMPQTSVPEKNPAEGDAIERRAEEPSLRQKAGINGEVEEDKMRFATAKERKTFEKGLFSEVRAIPAAKLEENRDGYAKLRELDPQNGYYQNKFEYYDNKIKERTKSFQNEILDEIARLQLDREALILELIARDVVDKTSVPGAWPRLWVAPGFYRLDFDTKQKVVGVVYEHYLAQDPRYDMVLVYDGDTGEKVGIYGEIQGGLNLY